MTDGREAKAAAVRVARARLQLKQEDVAALCGLDQSTISKAERGTAHPDTYTIILDALARVVAT